MHKALAAWVVSAASLIAVLIATYLINPGFFFMDDKQAQYAATFHYIGGELLHGHLPVLVTGQGTAANLLLDPQYGLANPIYWLQNIGFSLFDDLQLGTFLLAGVYLLILQAGTMAWVNRLCGSPVWAALAGTAMAVSGYAFWWVGPTWHPGLSSLAFLPWLGWALQADMRRRSSRLALVGASFAVFAGGWPFTGLAGAALCAASITESWLTQRRREAILKVGAIMSGGLLAIPTLIFLAFSLDWTTRVQTISNSNFLVPNIADIFNSSMVTAASDMNAYQGPVVHSPIMYAGGIGVTLACFIGWRRIRWSAPGVITLVSTGALFLLLSQMPTDVGPLRYPFRMLPAWQLVMVVSLSVAAVRLGLRITPRRIGLALVVAGASWLLSIFREPATVLIQTASLLLFALFLLALLRYMRGTPRVAALVPVTGIMAVMTLWGVGVTPANADLSNWGQPSVVQDYQQPLGAPETRILALYPPGDTERFAVQGVFLGQNYLYGKTRSGLGYTPIGQAHLQAAMCTQIWGFSCPQVTDFLTSVEPRSGKQWAELLGTRTIVAHDDFVPALEDGLDGRWKQGRRTADFTVMNRTDGAALPGRLTYDSQGDSPPELLSESPTSQSYRVPAGAGNRLLVFSDAYWPGYQARFNGQTLPVQPLDQKLVSVDIPAAGGDLQITYVPAGTRAAIACVVLALAILIISLIPRSVERSQTSPAEGYRL